MVEQWQCTLYKAQHAQAVCNPVIYLFHAIRPYNPQIQSQQLSVWEKFCHWRWTWYLQKHVKKWHYLSVVIWAGKNGLASSNNIHNITLHFWVDGRAPHYSANQFQTKHQNVILEKLKSGMAVLMESTTVNITTMTCMLRQYYAVTFLFANIRNFLNVTSGNILITCN
jgi:hypothetical protein